MSRTDVCAGGALPEHPRCVSLRPVTEPPRELDGASVLAYADLSGTWATGSVRHLRDGTLQDSEGFAYVALASYEDDSGCYVLYCEAAWEVQNDLLYDSRDDAERQVNGEFEGVQFVAV